MEPGGPPQPPTPVDAPRDPERPAEHGPRRRRRLARIALVVSVSLVILLFAIGAGLHTGPAKRYVLGRVSDYLASQQIGLQAGALNYNLLTLSVSLDDVVVRSRELPDAPPVARIGHVDARLALRDLLGGRYVVTAGSLRDADIHLRVDEQGRSNLPTFQSSSTSSEPVDYLIEHFSLTNARVRYEDLRQQLFVSLPVSTLTVEGDRTTNHQRIQLRAGAGELRLREQALALDKIDGALVLDRDALKVEQLDLTAAGSTMSLAGNVDGFADPRYDVALKARLDVTKLATFAGVADPVGGVIDADVKATGPLAKLAVRAAVKGEHLRYRTLQDMQLAADAVYDATAGQARVERLQLTGPLGSLRGDAMVALEPRAGESRIALDADDLDLARLSTALDLPYGAASRVDGKVNAHWPGLDYPRAAGDARLTFTPTRAGVTRGMAPVSGTLVATARPRAGAAAADAVTRNNAAVGGPAGGVAAAAEAFNSDVVVDAQRLQALGATVDGRVSLAGQRALGGALKVRAGDLAHVISAVERFLGRPRGSLVPPSVGPVAGSMAVDAALRGTVSAPVVEATIDAPGLAVGPAKAIALHARARYTTDEVTLTSGDVAWQSTRVQAAGRLGLQGRQPLDFTVTGDGTQIATTLAALGYTDIPASGGVAFQARVQGTVASPRAAVTLRGQDIAAYGEPIGVVSLDATFANQRLDVSKLQVDKPQPAGEGDGTLTAHGSYDLARERYTVDVSSRNLRLSTLALPDGRPVRAALDITAKGEGTLTNPGGEAKVAVSDLRLGQDELGGLTIDATAADRQAHVRARADKFNLSADARLSTTAPYRTTADVRLEDLDLATLPLHFDTPLTGTVRGTLTGTADLTNPAAGTATATIDRLAMTWNGQPIETDQPAIVRYAARRATIEQLRVRARDSVVSVRGDLPLDPDGAAGAIDIDAKANLATLAAYAPKDLGLVAEGDLALQGTVRGTLTRVDPRLTLTLANGSVSAKALPQPVSDVAVRLDVADGGLTIADIRAAWGAARLTAAGNVPLGWLPEDLPVEIPRQTGAATVRASVKGLDLATVPGAPERLRGTISMDADLNAPRPDVAALTGRVTFPELSLAFDQLTLAQQGVSTLAIDRGELRVERFALDGTAGKVDVTGSAGLIAPKALAITARANLNAGALSTFTESVRAAGRAAVEIAASGTIDAPQLKGFAELTNGRLLLDEPQVAATGLQARVDFTPTLVTLTRLDGSLNGGTIAGSGSVALEGTTPRNLDLRLKATEIALDTPLNLRSLSNADIRVTQRAADASTPPPPGEDEAPPEIVVGGLVTIAEAGLTDNINLDAGIFQVLTAPPSLDLTESRSALLERVRFDVQIKTETPIVIDNNLARGEIEADLRLLGTPYETGLSGRLDVTEGSELLLNERRYAVNRGVVTFIDDRRIAPSVDLQLETSARKYDITIAATGTPDDTTTTFTSSPALPEPDILALLVTGRTLDEMRGEEFDVAKSQVLSYLGGRVGSQLGRGLQRATGLSTVRVEPNLIATETNPGARLTVGQDLTDDLNLVYSTDLVNSSDNIWIAEYDVSRQFTTRAVRQSDASYRFDFRHDVRFGGQPEPNRTRRPRQTVSAVSVAGQPGIGEQELRDRFKLKAGDRYDFFSARDGVQRVTRYYRDHDWLQARLRVERVVKDDQVALTLRAVAGPKVTLQFEGYTPPKKFIAQAREIWSRGVFDTQRADDVRRALRTRLVDEKYLGAMIEYTLERPTPATRRAIFRVDPGVKFDKVTLAFEGASGISPKELGQVVKEQKLGPKVFTNPTAVTSLLERLYHERGFLTAEVDAPRPELDAASRQARVVVPIREGKAFTIRSVTLNGNKVYPTAALLSELPLVQGDPYYPATAERSLVRLRQLYWSRGYNDVRPVYALAVDREAGVLDVRFTIAEGRRTVIAGIDVQGNDQTSERLVRRELELSPGQPLDLSALSRSRKNLYGTGAYSLVDITREGRDAQAAASGTGSPATGASPAPQAGATPPTAPPTASQASTSASASAPSSTAAPAPAQTAAPATATSAATASTTAPSTTSTSAPATTPATLPAGAAPQTADEPVRVNVAVREVQPFQLRYGALFDTERGLGGILDISNHNSFGKARTVGLRSRYDSQVREARLYLSQPSLRSLPIETIASIYLREERNPATSRADAFNVDRYGIMLQQEKQLRDHYVWTYGYRFERARTYEADLAGPRPALVNVSPLTSTFTRETRDEVLDATTGSFFSQAFSFSPEWLGSDVPFIKYFGQYFRYFPLRPPQRKRFTNEILRPRLVFATGARLGLAHGIGGGREVPLSERFLAGGSTTLRGFGQNAVGPVGTDGVPLGGEAMFIINNELRFPLYSIVDGVAFVDIGNVFNRVSDFALSDLRESGGLGLRVRTPWLLVRVDYGVPFDRRAGEPRGRFFFSIGQAF